MFTGYPEVNVNFSDQASCTKRSFFKDTDPCNFAYSSLSPIITNMELYRRKFRLRQKIFELPVFHVLLIPKALKRQIINRDRDNMLNLKIGNQLITVSEFKSLQGANILVQQ